MKRLAAKSIEETKTAPGVTIITTGAVAES